MTGFSALRRELVQVARTGRLRDALPGRLMPLLEVIDVAAADPDYGYQRFGDIIDELASKADRAPGPRGDRRAAADRRFAEPSGVAALRRCSGRADPRRRAGSHG